MCQVWELLPSPPLAPSCPPSLACWRAAVSPISPFVLLPDLPSFHLLCFLRLIFLLARL